MPSIAEDLEEFQEGLLAEKNTLEVEGKKFVDSLREENPGLDFILHPMRLVGGGIWHTRLEIRAPTVDVSTELEIGLRADPESPETVSFLQPPAMTHGWIDAGATHDQEARAALMLGVAKKLTTQIQFRFQRINE